MVHITAHLNAQIVLVVTASVALDITTLYLPLLPPGILVLVFIRKVAPDVRLIELTDIGSL